MPVHVYVSTGSLKRLEIFSPFGDVQTWGVFLIAHYVVPAEDLDAKIEWLLARIVDKSPSAIRLGKMGYQALQDMALPEALEYAQLLLPMMARTEDAREGFQAFREKRRPKWTGR
jgi:enoyl-CoA hydratase/carnithine racemase